MQTFASETGPTLLAGAAPRPRRPASTPPARRGGGWRGLALALAPTLAAAPPAHAADGSGIFNTGSLTVIGSTFVNNLTSPAIRTTGTLSVVNSTFAGNGSGDAPGCAIHHSGPGEAEVLHSTLGVQHPDCATDVLVDPAQTLTLTHSILAGVCVGCADGGGNWVSPVLNPGLATISDAAILLGALQDNGGPTRTMAPLDGSPAIDALAVGERCPTIDQRGVPRPQGAGCDVGAVEVARATPPIIASSLQGPLGTNGWYVGDVTASWTVQPAFGDVVTVSSGCDPTMITTDTAEALLTCTANTLHGGSASKSVAVKRDAAPPVISQNLSPA